MLSNLWFRNINFVNIYRTIVTLHGRKFSFEVWTRVRIFLIDSFRRISVQVAGSREIRGTLDIFDNNRLVSSNRYLILKLTINSIHDRFCQTCTCSSKMLERFLWSCGDKCTQFEPVQFSFFFHRRLFKNSSKSQGYNFAMLMNSMSRSRQE